MALVTAPSDRPAEPLEDDSCKDYERRVAREHAMLLGSALPLREACVLCTQAMKLAGAEDMAERLAVEVEDMVETGR